jgi:transcriptional regulator with XRE-family HTH domain
LIAKGRIKKARTFQGLTQSDLAERLGLGLRQIQNLERNEASITMERLEDISRVLKVPISFFLEHEDESLLVASDIQKSPPRQLGDEIICEYTRNEETLKLTFPSHLSTEELREKVAVLVQGIFGIKIPEGEK